MATLFCMHRSVLFKRQKTRKKLKLKLKLEERLLESEIKMMDVMNLVLNLVVPPASLMMLGFAWPSLYLISWCEWIYANYFKCEAMENKVVVITGASSGIGEQIAYEYAKRGAKLVLVARREQRLGAISQNARMLGAADVLTIAADVVKEDECRRFINQTINCYGRVDHLVNTVSLGHTFYFEEATDSNLFPIIMDVNFWGNVYPTYVALPYLRQTNGRIVVNTSVENWLPLPRMSLYSAAKSGLLNFYETLRFEVKEEVGITVATHGWIGTEMRKGKFMMEEERQANVGGGPVVEFAKLIVSGACRGDPYVKFPHWYHIFFLYTVFAPKVLHWTFRFLLTNGGAAARPLLDYSSEDSSPRNHRRMFEDSSPRRFLIGGPDRGRRFE